MNSDFAFEIVDLALSVVKALAGGKVQQGATLAGLLVQIIAKAKKACEDHTGKPLDLSLIKAEDLV